MKERPILFSAPMVRSLLAGTKTQTRRVVKPEGAHHLFQFRGTAAAAGADEPTGEWGWCGSERVVNKHIHCPYGKPGDRLWVRETWNWFDPEQIPADRIGPRAPFTGIAGGSRAIRWAAAFAADGALPYPGYDGRDHWRPSIHMPRWASRITLEVVGVRVERLQGISEEDAKAEGAWGPDDSIVGKVAEHFGCDVLSVHPSLAFRMLWEQINGRDSWAANPWVWVVEFKRVEQGGAA